MSTVVQLATPNAVAPRTVSAKTAPPKDLYEIGEIPPLGHVPKNMYAWAIRRERSKLSTYMTTSASHGGSSTGSSRITLPGPIWPN